MKWVRMGKARGVWLRPRCAVINISNIPCTWTGRLQATLAVAPPWSPSSKHGVNAERPFAPGAVPCGASHLRAGEEVVATHEGPLFLTGSFLYPRFGSQAGRRLLQQGKSMVLVIRLGVTASLQIICKCLRPSEFYSGTSCNSLAFCVPSNTTLSRFEFGVKMPYDKILEVWNWAPLGIDLFRYNLAIKRLWINFFVFHACAGCFPCTHLFF